MKGDMKMLKRISNMMEDDGIRLQMEAELKREMNFIFHSLFFVLQIFKYYDLDI